MVEKEAELNLRLDDYIVDLEKQLEKVSIQIGIRTMAFLSSPHDLISAVITLSLTPFVVVVQMDRQVSGLELASAEAEAALAAESTTQAFFTLQPKVIEPSLSIPPSPRQPHSFIRSFIHDLDLDFRHHRNMSLSSNLLDPRRSLD